MKDKKFAYMSIKEVENADPDSRVIRFVATDETKDRDGEVLTVSGWDFKNFKRNPVFLWAHDYRQPSIGKVVNIEVDEKAGKVIQDVEFMGPDISKFADSIFRMYKGGFLNTVSVGFRPDYKSIKFDKETNTVYILKKEQLELSGVPVPANPSALQQTIKTAIMQNIINEQEGLELMVSAKSFYDNMKNAATPPVKAQGKGVPVNEAGVLYLDGKKYNISEIKSGRVLSKANEKLLRDAIEAVGKATETIAKVLDKVATQEPAPEGPKSETYPSFKGIYDNLFRKKAVSKSDNVELIDATLIDGMKWLDKKEN